MKLTLAGFVVILGMSGALASEPRLGCGLWRDARGIPHLRAATDTEAFGCLGYAHGRDRAWQMDYLRRVAQGRLAEVMGSGSVKSDFTMRLLGLAEQARRLAGGLGPEGRARLEAYARGATLGLEEAVREGVYEFRDFGYTPEAWRPEDSLALLLLQSFDQTRKTYQQRIIQSELRERLGPEAEALTQDDLLPWDAAILKVGEYRKGSAAASVSPRSAGSAPASAAAELRALFESVEELGLGSNNWVLAPSRSASGKAWLANDPHLALKYPSFWHWTHLSSPGLEVIGAAVPGIPAIVSGANRQVAWGLTNSYLDVTDAHFVPREELKSARKERPTIWVKFWKFRLPFFFKTFQRTEQGWPVVPVSSAPKVPAGREVVLRWSGFGIEASDVENLLRVMSARSVAELDQRLAGTGIPSWNFVFADVTGSIGYRAVGRIPKYDGVKSPYGIPESSLAELPRWTIRKPEEMPAVRDPARGFVVTANNRHWPVEARDFGGRAYSRGFRAFRIEELLLSRPKHDFESQRRIQCDVQAVDARFFLKPLLALAREAGSASPAFQALEKWQAEGKFETTPDCQACGLYRLWMNGVMERLQLREGGLFRALGKPDYPGLREAVLGALEEAAAAALGKTWGTLHRAPFVHLAGVDYRPKEPIPTSGDEQSVSPGTADWEHGLLLHRSGASQRLIVELSDPPRIRLVLPGLVQDTENIELARPDGPWMKWERCELEPVEFPLNWEAIPASELRKL
ncbi:MAG: penicillin acylase family protein [Oligoflexia bacterium]|nr:penicillin acylase family protein [Oligoflexia bacterium]